MRLLLARHAHAEDPGTAPSDHERGLTSRGRREAAALGEWLVAREVSPLLAICSSARRAIETLEQIVAKLPEPPDLNVCDEMYLASARRMFERVCDAPAEAPLLMLVAHNPGAAELAVRLAGRGEADALRELAHRFPPAALAVLDFDCPRWADVRVGQGVLVDLVLPG